MSTSRHATSRRAEAGFSLIELLVVVALIGLVAAVSLPNIRGFLRNYKVRGAADQVATNIQAARTRAVMKNANNGVVVVVQNPTTYWVHVEDDQGIPRQNAPEQLNLAAPDPAQSTRHELPQEIRFATAANQCARFRRSDNALAPFVPAANGLRFSRLGAACRLAGTACPAAAIAGATINAFHVDTIDGSLAACVVNERTGVHRWVRVTLGGRISGQQ